MKDYKQVCNKCGSEEVARCKWVNVNTDEIYGADSGTTLEWCFNCNDETSIVEERDYLINYILKNQEDIEWEDKLHLDFPFKGEDFDGMETDHIQSFKGELDDIIEEDE